MLESVPNLWKTVSSTGDKSYWVDEGVGFGGYADWTYNDFDGHISFRTDFDEENCEPLKVGTFGLCICCGDEIDQRLYCDKCKDATRCDECGDICDDDDLTTAYDEYGNEVRVCDSCIDTSYIYCEECNRWHHHDRMNVIDGRNICDSCRNEYYEECAECGEWYRSQDTYYVHTGRRTEGSVCQSCYDEYYGCCDECEEDYRRDSLNPLIRANGDHEYVCDDCARDYETCPHCNALIEVCDDGTCPNCGCVIEDEDEEKEETA